MTTIMVIRNFEKKKTIDLVICVKIWLKKITKLSLTHAQERDVKFNCFSSLADNKSGKGFRIDNIATINARAYFPFT